MKTNNIIDLLKLDIHILIECKHSDFFGTLCCEEILTSKYGDLKRSGIDFAIGEEYSFKIDDKCGTYIATSLFGCGHINNYTVKFKKIINMVK